MESGEGPVRGDFDPAGALIAPSQPLTRRLPGSMEERMEAAGRGVGVVKNQMDRDRVQPLRKRNAGKGAGGWDSQDTRASALWLGQNQPVRGLSSWKRVRAGDDALWCR